MTVSRKEFLERRRSGIGGSDVASILGVGYKTPLEVWQSKVYPPQDEPMSDRLAMGVLCEDAVAKMWQRHNPGKKLMRRNTLFRSKKHPALVADIDRWIIGEGGLEIKTVEGYAAKDFGADGDQVPDRYYLQCQHYMYVLERPFWRLAACVGYSTFKEYRIEYNRDLYEGAVLPRLLSFWDNFVISMLKPPPSYGDDLASYYTAAEGKTMTADEELVHLVYKAKTIRQSIKQASDDLDSVEFEIKTKMKDSEILIDASGNKLCTWKQSKGRSVTDWKAVAIECNAPENMIADNTEIKIGSRPLLIK